MHQCLYRIQNLADGNWQCLCGFIFSDRQLLQEAKFAFSTENQRERCSSELLKCLLILLLFRRQKGSCFNIIAALDIEMHVNM